jgi:cell division protein FtsB
MTNAGPVPVRDRPRIGAPSEDSIPGAFWSETDLRDLVPLARPASTLLIAIAVLGYVISGSNGIVKGGEYRRLKAERTAELALLDAERIRLAHRAGLLDPRGADVDLADEMIRSELGFVRPDEVIIELPD